MHVLILDDAEQTDLVFMETAANALGFEVETTSDPVQFRAAAREQKPDLQIVDVKLPEIRQRVGFSNGPELVAVTAAENEHIPTVFLTNYKGDCERFVSALDPRLVATTVEKPVSASSPADWRDRLSKAIKTIKTKPDFDHPKQLGVPIDELHSDFFRIPPKELQALPEKTRDELEIEATVGLDPYIQSAWSVCDADWMMLQSINETVLITDRGADEDLPNLNLITEIEGERNSTALIIGRPRVIEEVTSSGPVECTPDKRSRDWRRYPFVRLVVGADARDFHLDTGSPESYISREFLDSVITVPPGRAKRTIVSDLGGRQEVISQRPIAVDLHVSGPDGNAALSVWLQAVKNWRGASLFNPKCSGELCPDSTDGQCGRRMGLIGRDLLYSIRGGVWHFDPSNGQFYAAPPDL